MILFSLSIPTMVFSYAENSRETFRKQALHHFRNAALIEDNGLATNSPNYRYRLTAEFLTVVKKIGKKGYGKAMKQFLSSHERLIDKYASKRNRCLCCPLKSTTKEYRLSPGSHNQLQKPSSKTSPHALHPMPNACMWEILPIKTW